jgi:hypothetical protein
MEAENRSPTSLLRFLFRSERKVMASILPVTIVALAAGITTVWIGILGLLVVRLVEYVMALL